MAEKDKRYYWLKLHDDFFKRHDIRIIESMKNGKEYILFYLKLLCESTSHEGYLRFSEAIPYTTEMLATITGTNPDVAKSAMEVLQFLKLIEVMEDGTLNLVQMDKMIGSETYWAKKKREQRQNQQALLENNDNGTMSNDGQTCPSKKKTKRKNIYSAAEDAQLLFEELWKLYPKRKGKNQVKLSQQKELLEIGRDEMIRAIERYSIEVEGREAQYILNGNTFFNGRYQDYLDENYQDQQSIVKKNEFGA